MVNLANNFNCYFHYSSFTIFIIAGIDLLVVCFMSASAVSDSLLFSNFVIDISRTQRSHVASCIERTVKFENSWYKYLAGCFAFNVTVAYGWFKFKGPRNFFREWQNVSRLVVPTILGSVLLYQILYTFSLYAFRSQTVRLLDDYEYELKRVKAHHCKEGVRQLAWLQFMSEQIYRCNEAKLDVDKLRIVN